MDTDSPAGPDPALIDRLRARLERIARAEKRAQINFEGDEELFVLAATLRQSLARELRELTGAPSKYDGVDVEVPAEVVPTAEEARAIIAAEDALQERIGRDRVRTGLRKRLRRREADERHTPGRVLERGGWGPSAVTLRRELRAASGRHRGEYAGSVGLRVARTQTRARGAGRPQARHTPRSTNAPPSGGDDPPGGGDDPEPAEPAGPEQVAATLRRRARPQIDRLVRIGVSR